MYTYVLMHCFGENQLLFNSDIVLKLYLKHISQPRTSPKKKKTKPNTYNHRCAVPFNIIIKTRKKDIQYKGVKSLTFIRRHTCSEPVKPLRNTIHFPPLAELDMNQFLSPVEVFSEVSPPQKS